MNSKPTTLTLRHAVSIFIGCIFILSFFSLTKTATGLDSTFGVDFTYCTPGELLFWLSQSVLVLPGCLLLGYGISPLVSPWLTKTWGQVEKLTPREQVMGLIAIFVLGVSLARLGHAVIAFDFPVTDDENSTRLGGQILALGHVKIPIPTPFSAFPNLYSYIKDGYLTSVDWLGPQVAWAIAEVTGLGPFIFAVMAALPLPCLGYVFKKRLGLGWALAGVVLFFVSPLSMALSWTTHSHLLSRGLLALALVLFIVAEERNQFQVWGLTGLALGMSFCCRPIETTVLTFPLVLDWLIRWGRREPGASTAVAGLIAGAILPLGVLGWHNWLVTGNALLPARFAGSFIDLSGYSTMGASQVVGGKVYQSYSLWKRFGGNVGFNLLRVVVWFLGPLGVFLVGYGVSTDRFTKLLGIGVGIMLLVLGMTHDNFGVHVAGPLHYTDCAVPLTILAVHGLANLVRKSRQLGIDVLPAASAVACFVVVGLNIFNFWHGRAIYRQGLTQEGVYRSINEAMAQAKVSKAIILAPSFAVTWRANPEYSATGSWVLQWHPVRPDYNEPIMVLLNKPGVEPGLRERFPDRTFFLLSTTPEAPYLKIEPLPPSPAGPPH